MDLTTRVKSNRYRQWYLNTVNRQILQNTIERIDVNQLNQYEIGFGICIDINVK